MSLERRIEKLEQAQAARGGVAGKHPRWMRACVLKILHDGPWFAMLEADRNGDLEADFPGMPAEERRKQISERILEIQAEVDERGPDVVIAEVDEQYRQGRSRHPDDQVRRALGFTFPTNYEFS